MTIQENFLNELNILELKISGRLSTKDLEVLIQKINSHKTEGKPCAVLIDATKVESFPQTYSVLEFSKEIAKFSRVIKIALLKSNTLKDDFDFIDTVVVNRHGDIGLVKSRQKAFKWLKN